MDSLEQLKLASSEMDLEPAEDAGCPKIREGKTKEPFLSNAVLPGGKQITLAKTLLTSACERNCYYCPFRAGRDFRRTTFKPEEMARTFMGIHQAGIAQGIFLSSGIVGGGVRTQDKLIATAEILRKKYEYSGYLHLKLMPGAERAQIERTMRLADRVSINLEAPNSQRLERLAPGKTFLDELLQPLRWVEEIRQSQPAVSAWNRRWPSTTTQFVVGAAGESDLELLKATAYLHQKLRIRRAYYSAFRPIHDTPLENLPPESPVRQQRLYQADFLLRDYGFQLEDFALDALGNLPLTIDPKTAWAKIHLLEQPVEVNRASRQDLLRIPGIGPKSADAIMAARRQGRLRDPEDLFKIGINAVRALPFILIGGRKPVQQLTFW